MISEERKDLAVVAQVGRQKKRPTAERSRQRAQFTHPKHWLQLGGPGGNRIHHQPTRFV